MSQFKRIIICPSYSSVRFYRISNKYAHKGRGWIAQFFYRLNLMLNGADIHPRAIIGDNLTIAHPIGIVIGECKIGNNLLIYQNVTLGVRNGSETDGYPTLGDNVYIGSGAAILGPIKIGNNVKIGANSVVLTDIPDDCTVVGVPARIIAR